MVFPEVNCPGDHAEGVRQVRGSVGIVLSAGIINNTGKHGMGGRHGDVSVVVGGVFEPG